MTKTAKNGFGSFLFILRLPKRRAVVALAYAPQSRRSDRRATATYYTARPPLCLASVGVFTGYLQLPEAGNAGCTAGAINHRT